MQNILELARQFNWVDILVMVVFLRLIFISLKQGLGIEFFKFAGTVCALYLAFHYYFIVASFISVRSGGKNSPQPILEFAAYLLLFTFGYLLFWAFRVVTFRFMDPQVSTGVSKWGGLIFGFLRSFLLSSLIMFALVIPGDLYFKDSVRYSFSGRYLSRVAPATYTFIWESIVSKFNSGEKFNSAVRDVYSVENKQKKKND